ncbi:hypothetical protein SISNIDRAFT_483134 [Sistotremastrum niveocremeum HHB9708]|uniref:Uncharacterized protein n=1 Tax=Sistotremastrum niveocremeum HHB9708 TaxID=1314777 RepID=A0A164Y4U4_9AGAM|nr:hypothetical protein SISNIDRAFT_483134 [Sistotremastrum niveocremeum HHB9708]
MSSPTEGSEYHADHPASILDDPISPPPPSTEPSYIPLPEARAAIKSVLEKTTPSASIIITQETYEQLIQEFPMLDHMSDESYPVKHYYCTQTCELFLECETEIHQYPELSRQIIQTIQSRCLETFHATFKLTPKTHIALLPLFEESEGLFRIKHHYSAQTRTLFVEYHSKIQNYPRHFILTSWLNSPVPEDLAKHYGTLAPSLSGLEHVNEFEAFEADGDLEVTVDGSIRRTMVLEVAYAQPYKDAFEKCAVMLHTHIADVAVLVKIEYSEDAALTTASFEILEWRGSKLCDPTQRLPEHSCFNDSMMASIYGTVAKQSYYITLRRSGLRTLQLHSTNQINPVSLKYYIAYGCPVGLPLEERNVLRSKVWCTLHMEGLRDKIIQGRRDLLASKEQYASAEWKRKVEEREQKVLKEAAEDAAANGGVEPYEDYS